MGVLRRGLRRERGFVRMAGGRESLGFFIFGVVVVFLFFYKNRLFWSPFCKRDLQRLPKEFYARRVCKGKARCLREAALFHLAAKQETPSHTGLVAQLRSPGPGMEALARAQHNWCLRSRRLFATGHPSVFVCAVSQLVVNVCGGGSKKVTLFFFG